MLQELSIQNFALIEDQTITFGPQMNVLSGETGAGKSMIIEAVALLMGSRLTANLIRTGAEFAQLEAFFDISPKSDIARKMRNLDLNPEEGLFVRRILSTTGRPKIYINNYLATAQTLGELTQDLISISGQHAHQRLLEEETHLFTLDTFANLLDLRNAVRFKTNSMLPLIRQLSQLVETKKHQQEKIESLSFQLQELSEAALIAPGEDDLLSQQRTRLKNIETIHNTLSESVNSLYRQPGAIVEQLTLIARQLEKIIPLDSSLEAIGASFQEIGFQLEDATSSLEKHLRSLELNGQSLEEIESRLTILNRLKRKYGPSLDDVIARKEQISSELSQISIIDEEISKIQNELIAHQKELSALCQQLSEKRHKAAKQLCAKIEAVLKTLQMPHARLIMAFAPIRAKQDTSFYFQEDEIAYTSTGMDRAAFRFSANPGETEKPLAQIASGGELSRVVLAIKVVLNEKGSGETIIFDEVDAGIGGSTAEAIGKKLKELSVFHQIICITHSAQIAKFGNLHFVIEKQIRNGRTQTHIRFLSQEDRVHEIARMIGGATITSATFEHAKELLLSQ